MHVQSISTVPVDLVIMFAWIRAHKKAQNGSPAQAKVVRSCTGNFYCREMARQVADPAQLQAGCVVIAARCGRPAVKNALAAMTADVRQMTRA